LLITNYTQQAFWCDLLEMYNGLLDSWFFLMRWILCICIWMDAMNPLLLLYMKVKKMSEDYFIPFSAE
jgi:hypothetical protein